MKHPLAIMPLALAATTWAQDAAPGRSMRLAPSADTYIAAFPVGEHAPKAKHSEQSANAGASTRLKIKRHENIPLLKFDLSALPSGASVREAELVVTMTDPGMRLGMIAAWSLHVPWNEGRGTWDDGTGPQTSPDANHDGACYFGPAGPASRWLSYPGSDFPVVAHGNAGGVIGVHPARNLGGGRFAIRIDPAVIHAAQRDGGTIALTDETGAWDTYSNAFFWSREAGNGTGPELTVAWEQGVDTTPPAFAGPVVAEAGPDPGSVLLRLPAAGDDGVSGTALEYEVRAGDSRVPLISLPRPGARHRNALITGLPLGKAVTLRVAAIDEAGNRCEAEPLTATACPAFSGTLQPEPARPALNLPAAITATAFTARLADGVTLYDPLSGGLSPQQQRTSGVADVVRAARGEILGLQVLVALAAGTEKLDGISVTLQDAHGAPLIPGAQVEQFRAHYVRMGESWIADILAPVPAGTTLAIPSQADLPGQRQLAIYADVIIPAATKPGVYAGSVRVTSAAGEASVPFAIDVVNVAIPDTLSFDIEMNSYGHSDKPEMFHAVYRLCHKHRLSYNVVGYGHTRPDSHTTPRLAGSGADLRVVDWSTYDAFYGPLFTGEVAKGLPRDGVPAAHWYLPFHDAWPVSLEATDPHRAAWEGRVAPKTDKKAFAAWVDRMCGVLELPESHFSPTWREGNAAVVRQFIAHARERGWTRTEFQVFSNHKYYMAGGSQSLWTMDEPQYGRDYRALDWLLSFHDGLFRDSGLRVALRADISRPTLGGSRFDRGLDLTVGYTDCDERFLVDRVKSQGITQAWYGGGRAADADPALYAALFLKKWAQGCSSGMPNWTFDAGNKAWDVTDPLRYMSYDPSGAPVASVRMKACRYGQQLIELANLAAAQPGWNRWRVAELLLAEFPVRMVIVSKGPEDPGYATFENLDVALLERLRARLLATLASTAR